MPLLRVEGIVAYVIHTAATRLRSIIFAPKRMVEMTRMTMLSHCVLIAMPKLGSITQTIQKGPSFLRKN